MHFLSPHVLSTEKEPKTTMGSSRQPNITGLIKSRRSASSTSREIPGIVWPKMRSRTRNQFVYELLWKHQRQHARPGNHVSGVLCTGQETERSTAAKFMSGSRKHGRRRKDNVRFGSTRCHRRRGTARDCVSHMAVARHTVCGRIETDTCVSKRNGPRICMLQSQPLEPTHSTRYLIRNRLT